MANCHTYCDKPTAAASPNTHQRRRLRSLRAKSAAVNAGQTITPPPQDQDARIPPMATSEILAFGWLSKRAIANAPSARPTCDSCIWRTDSPKVNDVTCETENASAENTGRSSHRMRADSVGATASQKS